MYISQRRNDVKEAMEFAKEMANQEIASVERLHQRTIKQLTILVTVFVFMLSALGALATWFGFSTIRDAAVRTAKTQMQQEIVRQVQGKLTNEHLDEMVKVQVNSYSKSAMDAAIQKDLQSEPLRSEIRNAAVSAATGMVKTKFAPRHLTDAQCNAFAAAIASYPDLDGYFVSILHNAINNEAEGFENDIIRCIPRTPLKRWKDISYSGPHVDGVGLLYCSSSSKEHAQHLQAAFASVGIEAKLVPEGGLVQADLGDRQPISIWVGNREIK